MKTFKVETVGKYEPVDIFAGRLQRVTKEVISGMDLPKGSVLKCLSDDGRKFLVELYNNYDDGVFGVLAEDMKAGEPGVAYVSGEFLGNSVVVSYGIDINLLSRKDLIFIRNYGEDGHFRLPRVSVSIVGRGMVQGAGFYEIGEAVNLRAEAWSGYKFERFENINTGEVSEMSNYTFTMPDADVNVRAFFRAMVDNVILTYEGMGSVSGQGEYDTGAQVTINAVAAFGYRFVRWENADTGAEFATSAIHTFTKQAGTINLRAIFEVIMRNVTVTVEGQGTVTGAGPYAVGATVELEATPDDGHVFVRWEDDL